MTDPDTHRADELRLWLAIAAERATRDDAPPPRRILLALQRALERVLGSADPTTGNCAPAPARPEGERH